MVLNGTCGGRFKCVGGPTFNGMCGCTTWETYSPKVRVMCYNAMEFDCWMSREKACNGDATIALPTHPMALSEQAMTYFAQEWQHRTVRLHNGGQVTRYEVFHLRYHPN
eukprot:jgi/Botrbrau1/19507/Bobra.0035s0008.1